MSGTGRADFGPRSLADVTAMLAVLPAGAVIRIGDQTFSRTPAGQVAITGAVLIDGVNDIALASAAAGSAPSIQTVGADATIGLTLALKGNGTLNLQGGLAVGVNTLAATASMNLNAAPGQVKQVAFQSGGVGRWVAGSTPAAETGGNAGSDYVVSRFDDGGNFLGNPIAINRASGAVSLPSVAVGGGSIDGTAVGTGTPSTGAFTTARIGGNAATNAQIAINGAVGTFRQFLFETAGVVRWAYTAGNGAESGANAGSNFQIDAYADNGAYLYTPISIIRSTGSTNINRGIEVAGGGNINGVAIGGTTAAAGRFTTVTLTGHLIRSLATALTAAGTTQAAALALTASINVVTTAAAGSGVRLPAPGIGGEIVVRNQGANAVNIYPPTNGIINALAANAAFSLAAGTAARFVQATATQYYTV